jgi:hypothetical protein
MTNDEARMTNGIATSEVSLRISSFGFLSSFGFRHSGLFSWAASSRDAAHDRSVPSPPLERPAVRGSAELMHDFVERFEIFL